MFFEVPRTALAALGFAPSTTDPSLFLRTNKSLPPFYFLVYVDDLIFAIADTEVLTLVKSELQKRHTCTDLGELRSYLGLQITRDRARRTITLTQSHMVHQVLQRYGFQFSSPQPTPLSTGHSLSAPPSDESVESSGPYPELVGCLMYLMTCTRTDLAYPLSLLACYVAPGRHQKVHWDAAKRVLHYLCSTLGMGLVLGGWGLVVLTGHADASWHPLSSAGFSASAPIDACWAYAVVVSIEAAYGLAMNGEVLQLSVDSLFAAMGLTFQADKCPGGGSPAKAFEKLLALPKGGVSLVDNLSRIAPPFWIIRNSWGEGWGDRGHMRMDIQGGDGVCGINMLPSIYPIVKSEASIYPISRVKPIRLS
ncbi:unnamed protein product [Closterium sp. NIES-54]